MKNMVKETFKMLFSLLFVVSILIILFSPYSKSMGALDAVTLGFILGYSSVQFVKSIIYFYKFFTYKNIVESNNYTVENRKKYNKFGEYFINRGVITMGDKKIKGNWSIDFERISQYKSPLKCKSNGEDMIIIG